MREYRNEIPFDSSITIKDLEDIIRDIVKQEIKKIKADRKYRATIVQNNGDGTANIKLQDGTNIISNVKIREGLSLFADDEVYITAINGSLNNIFIDIKK